MLQGLLFSVEGRPHCPPDCSDHSHHLMMSTCDQARCDQWSPAQVRQTLSHILTPDLNMMEDTSEK